MSKLYVLIGGVCTGKSTYASNFMKYNPDFKLIKADEIFSKYGSDEDSQNVAQLKMIATIEEFCKNGDNIIYDGINIVKKSRKYYINLAKKYSYYVIGVDFGSSNFEYLSLRKANDNTHDWYKQSMIDDMKYDLPSESEGFDKIIIEKHKLR